MKIAYISGAYIPDRGADSMHVMAMCEAMADNGHDVTLYVRPATEPALNDFEFYGVKPNFRIVKLARPQVRVWGALVNGWLSGDRVVRDAPDLIYAREYYGLAFAARSGIPFVYELHWVPRHAAERALQRWIFRRPGMQRIVFISDRLRDLYRREYPWLSPLKLLVAHDAANLAPKSDKAAQSAPVKRLRVGYVGGMLPGYGIDVIVALARKHPEYDFHVVGGRDPQVAAWRAKSVGLANLTLHGFVPPSQLSEHYRNFDVVLAPYQRETKHIDWISPMKLFEYMAYGKAIVCADFPVMREILRDGEDALLVPPDDLAAYGRALERLTDAAFREQLGRNSEAKLAREFTWLRRAQNVLSGIDL